jgi:hypothetical protein
MADGIKCDWSEFDTAIKQYAGVSKRTFSQIINSKLGDVAFRASSFADKAQKSSIQTFRGWKYSEFGFAKFIQKVIHLKGGFNLHYRRRIKKKEVDFASWIDPVTKRKMTGRRKTAGVDRKATGAYQDAVKVGKAIIKRRIQTIGTFRAVFAVTALAFGKLASKVERKGRNWLTVTYANENNLMATFVIPFKNTKPPWPGGTRPTPEADVRKKVMMSYGYLQKGIDFVTADMNTHVEEKMKADAERFSAK